MSGTKGDLITGAFSRLRISGLTVVPGAADNSLALGRLESMAAEFYGRNICTGYNFEDTPDTSSLHNMQRKFWGPYEAILATRLLGDYGKQPSPGLQNEANAGFSFLSSVTAKVRETQYPPRQPTGSGNTRRGLRWYRYYNNVPQAPNECATNDMFEDDRRSFAEHFDAYLEDGETISSFTIEADTGLTVNSSSISGSDILYNITATGSDSSDSLLQVKIVITTSGNRIQTRIINFSITDTDIIDS